MRYSIGESLADFGFHFLENIHEPIFLVNRLGKLVKVNEAGRKFLNLTQIETSTLQDFVKTKVMSLFHGIGESSRRVNFGKCHRLIARSFAGSEYILIEVIK
jgi:hypothetical protein